MTEFLAFSALHPVLGVIFAFLAVAAVALVAEALRPNVRVINNYDPKRKSEEDKRD